MAETVELYSLADVDRSGKVRWTAAELGLTVVENRVGFGAHRKPPYTELNPYGHVPTARFRGEVLLESTAICQALADAFPDAGLRVDPGEPGRRTYLYWLAVFTETLEARLVECAVSRSGLLGPEYFQLHERTLRRKIEVVSKQLPETGFLCGDRFTLADICAGYSLRLAVQCGFLEAVPPYLERLTTRPAAVEARIFDSLER